MNSAAVAPPCCSLSPPSRGDLQMTVWCVLFYKSACLPPARPPVPQGPRRVASDARPGQAQCCVCQPAAAQHRSGGCGGVCTPPRPNAPTVQRRCVDTSPEPCAASLLLLQWEACPAMRPDIERTLELRLRDRVSASLPALMLLREASLCTLAHAVHQCCQTAQQHSNALKKLGLVCRC